MSSPSHISVPRFKNGAWHRISDAVTEERPISVSWHEDAAPGEHACTLWAWPEDLASLALGHVLLDRAVSDTPLRREATVEAAGSMAFRVRVGASLPGNAPLPPQRWPAKDLLEAMRAFIGAGGLWDGTGCFHRAGVYDVRAGKLLARAEDIGRHNCVDRLAGWSMQSSVPLSDKALLISARMTSSLCAKALRAGFRIIASRSAVTTAAIAMCEETGATLAGFVRTDEERFTVFADAPGRLGAPVAE